MKTKLFLFTLALAAGTASAQNQIVNDRPGTFVDISGLAGAQALAAANADDVGYSFTSTVSNAMFLAGTVRPNSNGYVQFGGATGSATFTNAAIASGNVSPVAPTTTQALFPFWDDQYLYLANSANIYWIEGPAASFGLPANRGNVLIIQWTNIDHFLTSPEKATYQVQIFSNIVSDVAAQMLYQNVFDGNATYQGGGSATIGFAAGTTGGAASVGNVQWSFNTLDAVAPGTVLSVLVPVGPTNPSGSGSAVTGPTSAVLRVAASGGLNPNSTGLAVAGDLSAYGGSATTAFRDDGLNGDATAGDGIFSYTFTYPAGTTDGQAFSIPFTVSDAQSRSSTNTLAFMVDVAGDMLTTALVPAGSGSLDSLAGVLNDNDVDMFLINVCDAGNFSATTVGGSTADTKLFLFDTNGMGVAVNDDSQTTLQSTITNAFVSTSGNYYIAISRYPALANDSGGQAIWLGTPFASERSPDGPGAANPLGGWSGAPAGTATYTVSFTGTCYPTNNTRCSPADVGMAGGVAGQDRLLNNNDFIAFITLFFAQDAQADLGTAGGVAGSDNAWDNNDFIAFISYFFNDQAACNG